MNVSCTNCPAKYAVPDDKVRGRKVRITCKRCGAPIIVDGTTLTEAALPGTAERPVQNTIAGGAEAPDSQAPLPRAANDSAVKPAAGKPAEAPAPAEAATA